MQLNIKIRIWIYLYVIRYNQLEILREGYTNDDREQ